MRVATIRTEGGTRAVRVDGNVVTPLAFAGVRELLESGADWRARAERAAGQGFADEGVSFAPLVPRPEKIIVLGWNYLDHVAEGGAEVPKYPSLFAKYTRALIGAYDPIAMPPESISSSVDAEVELGIVVGKQVYRANPEQARAAIAGFTIINDMSVRDWQFRSPFPLQGKTWERMTPVGPWLVTPDEVDDAKDLRVECVVDGVGMQDARTSNMIFKPHEIVAYVSTIVTLDPGDLISMGTPSGVGFARKPPVFLKPGQTVTAVIEGIGELVNRCVPEAEWAPAPLRRLVAH